MKFGVVVFPGSNCDEDIVHVLSNELGQETEKLWHKERDVKGCDFIVLPGGFSYGDYLRSGAIARFSPIMEAVVAHANAGGYVMGICNGFQILCESHLLPGALLHNNERKFICRNVYLRPQSRKCIASSGVEESRVLRIPIAHGEGRYYASPEVLQELNDMDQVIYRYCDFQGNITEESNPNGAEQNIAGICNRSGNVFGMMPHPERASSGILGNTDGREIFESILQLTH